jgi:hypothetical protein
VDDDCRMGCCGDCNQDGTTSGGEFGICNTAATTDEVIPIECAACDCDGNGLVQINDVLLAGDRALNGCPITGMCP